MSNDAGKGLQAVATSNTAARAEAQNPRAVVRSGEIGARWECQDCGNDTGAAKRCRKCGSLKIEKIAGAFQEVERRLRDMKREVRGMVGTYAKKTHRLRLKKETEFVRAFHGICSAIDRVADKLRGLKI